MSNGTEAPAADFIVNRLAFWLSLFVGIAAAAGIGFKVATFLRKKVNEDKNELREEIRTGLDKQRQTLEVYIKDIATPAAERRDKQEFLMQQLDKRIAALEQQQGMTLQIVLQNQQAIRDSMKNGAAKRD